MFKNATVVGFKPSKSFLPIIPNEHRFTPPSSVELLRSGWSPVRDDVYCYANNGQFLFNFTTEKKILPAAAVKLVADAKAAELAEQQGFPLGKEAMKALKEQVTDELLPRALTTRSTTRVWLDPKAGRIVIDSASSTVVDTVQVALVRAFGDLGLQDVAWPRAKVVTEFMFTEPEGFTVDDQVVLQYPGERGKLVKFDRANLGEQDVLQHIQKGGAQVSALAMTFDAKLSFVMTDNAQLRRIRALDVLKETADAAKDVDRFDSDFVLMTGELGRLFDALAAEA
jgi:recombination associated protein RdgC